MQKHLLRKTIEFQQLQKNRYFWASLQKPIIVKRMEMHYWNHNGPIRIHNCSIMPPEEPNGFLQRMGQRQDISNLLAEENKHKIKSRADFDFAAVSPRNRSAVKRWLLVILARSRLASSCQIRGSLPSEWSGYLERVPWRTVSHQHCYKLSWSREKKQKNH